MKKLALFLVFAFPLIAFAQSAPVQTGGTVSVVSPLISAALIASVCSIVVCLNIALSAVQQIFAKLAKTEPGALQQISSVVAKIAQYIGSNPSL